MSNTSQIICSGRHHRYYVWIFVMFGTCLCKQKDVDICHITALLNSWDVENIEAFSNILYLFNYSF